MFPANKDGRIGTGQLLGAQMNEYWLDKRVWITGSSSFLGQERISRADYGARSSAISSNALSGR